MANWDKQFAISISQLPDPMGLTNHIVQFRNRTGQDNPIDIICNWTMLYPVTLRALYFNCGNWQDAIAIARRGIVDIDTMYIVYNIPIIDLITYVNKGILPMVMMDLTSTNTKFGSTFCYN